VAGKVWHRTGHASQTIVVLPTTYGLMALEREMSTPPIPSRSVAIYLYLIGGDIKR